MTEGLANTVKVAVEVNEGIASATVVECPPGVAVDVEIRDFDTEGTDFTGMVKGEDYDTEEHEGGKKIRYLIGNGTVHEASGQMITALAAIVARISGEFDHPALAAYGPLSTDTMADVLAIARHEFRIALPALTIDQLAAGLRHRNVAAVIMQPADVLSRFNLSQDETGDDDETAAARLGKAAEWLAENRKYVENPMTEAGFEAFGALADAKEFSVASDAGPWGIWWSEAESWKTDNNATVYEFPSADAAEAFIRSDLRDDVLAGCSFVPRRLPDDAEEYPPNPIRLGEASEE